MQPSPINIFLKSLASKLRILNSISVIVDQHPLLDLFIVIGSRLSFMLKASYNKCLHHFQFLFYLYSTIALVKCKCQLNRKWKIPLLFKIS